MAKKPNFLEGEFNLPQLEEKVLKFWSERNIFEKSLEKNKPGASEKNAKGTGKKFVFYEGPPYANGKPAIHHILSRVVKDIILRYKTMRGYYVPRRAGWDTHGLPVEMAAEKALGFKSKRDIEKFGVKRFNEEAKKQVWIYKDEWERLTNRIGYWLDLKNAYVTYEPDYIETIWWTLAQIWKRDLLYKGHKVVPWCTRCGTALSSHELAQGYKEIVDRSVYIKFKLKNPEKIGLPKKNVYILSWTTTPWTLPGNVALAVGEKIDYSVVNIGAESYILATNRIADVLKEIDKAGIGKSFKGKDLVGLSYEPLFEVAPLKTPKAYKVYPADFVTTTDGTGVVHTAVMYGEDDYELGKKIGLPQHHTVSEEGKFLKDVPALAGDYVKSKETEDAIFEHLRAHGTLLRIEEHAHEYPFCWRCGTAVLYYARTSWFIGMSRLRKELLARNETINWMPEHVKEGRFGEWLREAKDWNLSRERYWGAPLPIWECAKCGHTEVVQSLAELDSLGGGGKNNYFAMRHGESENVLFKLIDSGDQKFHLTKRGQAQVAKAAKALKAKKIDLIFSSDLPRTKESAAILAKELGKKVIYDKRLREIYLSTLSGKPLAEYRKKIAGLTREEWFANHVEPQAESVRDLRTRVWGFLKEIEKKYRGKNILIVSHADSIWMMAEVALGWSEKEAGDRKVASKNDFIAPAETIEFMVKSIPRDDTGLIDLHRPFVDDVVLKCPECAKKKGAKGTMRRVREVADVWYDSGAMPYAQNHFPFAQQETSISKTKNKKPELPTPPDFPANYIAEGMDQTRGWFYTLLSIATALGYDAPYKNVVSLGLVNDKFGQKMSKSKGNVVEPFAVIEKFGVDALRWYFYSNTPFGEPKNFDEQEVGKTLRKVHLIIYNSFVFWKTYAKTENRKQGIEKSAASKNVLDEWIMVRLNGLIDSVTKKIDKYEIREAALEIEAFVDDLSRWYIRRSRRRLQKPEDQKDYEAASATLGFVLAQLIKLMAPFTPFFSEILHSAMGDGAESVHLETWPETKSDGNKKLLDDMRAVRELAALGLAKRAEAKIKVRQPLAALKVKEEKKFATLKNSKKLLDVLAEEVNVKKIIFDAKLADVVELDTAITPELREEGWVREVARMVQELRQTAKLSPKDKVALMISVPEAIKNAIARQENAFKTDVGAKTIVYQQSDKFDAEESTEIDGGKVWIGMRKL